MHQSDQRHDRQRRHRHQTQAFVGCSSLTCVTIPDSATSIGELAFAECYSLTCVTIPDSVTNIDEEAFAYCYSLTAVDFLGDAPVTVPNASVFTNDNNATVYYVPGTTGWGATFDDRPTAQWTGQSIGTVTVTANPSQGGSVTGSGTYAPCSSQQISASPNSGWTFIGWSDGSTENPRTITVLSCGASYTANFATTGGGPAHMRYP